MVDIRPPGTVGNGCISEETRVISDLFMLMSFDMQPWPEKGVPIRAQTTSRWFQYPGSQAPE